MRNVVVWGTGNVGRPALRAVLSDPRLQLVGCVVSDPAKEGRDAGELCGLPPVGVAATRDTAVARAADVDCVVYAATGDTRPLEALEDVTGCLRAGANVVSTSLYGLLYPPALAGPIADQFAEACKEGSSSIFVSGIDPGWALDVLPLLLSGVVADLQEVRSQEVFNYALYDQPDVVRNVIGFGGSMDELPAMLNEFALRSVWEPMVRTVADGLGVSLDRVETEVERRPLERSIEVSGMGRFEAGTQGAFRFEVRGIVGEAPRIVVEHVTRIDDACAPEWTQSPGGQSMHRVLLRGRPSLTVDLHSEDPSEPGAGAGGNATAANRVVLAIPDVCAAPPGPLGVLDLPTPRAAVRW
ncbi:MAG: dihydrodipicolinate reductase [Myxococcota bacterium]